MSKDKGGDGGGRRDTLKEDQGGTEKLDQKPNDPARPADGKGDVMPTRPGVQPNGPNDHDFPNRGKQ